MSKQIIHKKRANKHTYLIKRKTQTLDTHTQTLTYNPKHTHTHTNRHSNVGRESGIFSFSYSWESEGREGDGGQKEGVPGQQVWRDKRGLIEVGRGRVGKVEGKVGLGERRGL